MKLPESYLSELTELIGKEGTEKYLSAMEEPYVQALRANTLKADPKTLRELFPTEYLEEDVPWCAAGIYLSDRAPAMSGSPYYAAGLYYLQEPSAMAPASFLPVYPGDRVLDLCAAPGGKTTALGAKLGGEGFLLANDISPSRAQALIKNIELFGIPNAAVSAEAPYRLAPVFRGWFDKVLVDAPCSGEGMFRKDPSIIRSWEQYGSAYYGKLQREILPYAAEMTAPGGMLLYSTCTYSLYEDEEVIAEFLDAHPDWTLLELPKKGGIQDGFPISGRQELVKCARFWPHHVRGEGHFAALLQHSGDALLERTDGFADGTDLIPEAFAAWARESLQKGWREALPVNAGIRQTGDRVYGMLLDRDRMKGLRVLSPGLLLGEIRHDRFEPSQSLAMVLRKEHVRAAADLRDRGETESNRYLKGETLSGDYPDGWILLTYGGYPLGWGKSRNGTVKNKYQRGWRLMK